MLDHNAIVFFDFDGTLCSIDSLDLLFSKNISKIKIDEIEQLWRSGNIGSYECLNSLFKIGNNINDSSILKILPYLKVSNGAIEILQYLKSVNATIYIVSDGIGEIIFPFLKENNLEKYFSKVYCNSFALNAKGVFTFENCNDPLNVCHHKVKCALCKENIVNFFLKNYSGISLYFGDGKSDLLGSSLCDYIFAKKNLYELLPEKGNTFLFDKFQECKPALKSIFNPQ